MQGPYKNESASRYIGILQLVIINGMTITKSWYMHSAAAQSSWIWITQTNSTWRWYGDTASAQLNNLNQLTYYACIG